METVPLTQAEIDWICTSIRPNARLLAATELVGATTSKLFLCELEIDKAISSANSKLSNELVVLRRYSVSDQCLSAAEMVVQEALALEAANNADLPTPCLIASDLAASNGRNPVLLMSCVPGRVVLMPPNIDNWLREMAGALYAIHQVPADYAPYHYFPWYDEHQPTVPEWSAQCSEWETAISIALGAPPNNPQHFIHRDFHPCNVLFNGDRLSGVVDWVNGCRGMAGVDIAHCRWNLALLHGIDAADRFVDMYREFAGRNWTYDPYFDLVELCEKSWTPNIYLGWLAHKVSGLTDRLMLERTEAMLLSALARL
jgi:Ser/Thr protein kinase RdoA (MazF antagonist)